MLWQPHYGKIPWQSMKTYSRKYLGDTKKLYLSYHHWIQQNWKIYCIIHGSMNAIEIDIHDGKRNQTLAWENWIADAQLLYATQHSWQRDRAET